MSGVKKPMSGQDVQDLLDSLRVPFLDSSQQKLDRLNEMIDVLWEDRKQTADFRAEFFGIVHSLKGSGGSFGFPHITIICHHFETYFDDLYKLTDEHLADIQLFLDMLATGLSFWPAPNEDEVEKIVKSLPQKPLSDTADAEGKSNLPLNVLLISQAVSIAQLAKFFCIEFGCDVVEEKDPFAAFQQAVESKPQLVISSVVLEGLSGIDLVAALKSMKVMADCHFALLSSASDIGEISVGTPEGVSIIATDDMEAGIEDILEKLGMVFEA